MRDIYIGLREEMKRLVPNLPKDAWIVNTPEVLEGIQDPVTVYLVNNFVYLPYWPEIKEALKRSTATITYKLI